jgi:hypothetical protein
MLFRRFVAALLCLGSLTLGNAHERLDIAIEHSAAASVFGDSPRHLLVSPSGNDTACRVDDTSPCRTLAAAVSYVTALSTISLLPGRFEAPCLTVPYSAILTLRSADANSVRRPLIDCMAAACCINRGGTSLSLRPRYHKLYRHGSQRFRYQPHDRGLRIPLAQQRGRVAQFQPVDTRRQHDR